VACSWFSALDQTSRPEAVRFTYAGARSRNLLSSFFVKLARVRLRQTIRPSVLGRHVHRRPYAALVLAGRYEEAGDTGRHRVGAGDIIFHEAFEAHLNRVPASGAEVLNLPLPVDFVVPSCVGRINDPDAIAARAEKDDCEAAALLLSSVEMQEPRYGDWPDDLAATLIGDASLSLSSWSEENGISAWSVSRGFAQIFGISPSGFRARVRAQQAWKAIQGSDDPLADIAAQYGFADQSHMTRDVKKITGRCPSAWRPTCK
jgi:AraC-like DNA-binding protein